MADEATTGEEMMTDSAGQQLSRSQVVYRAKDNIRYSMGLDQLVDCYLDSLDDDDLLMWATDDEGKFGKPEIKG